MPNHLVEILLGIVVGILGFLMAWIFNRVQGISKEIAENKLEIAVGKNAQEAMKHDIEAGFERMDEKLSDVKDSIKGMNDKLCRVDERGVAILQIMAKYDKSAKQELPVS